MLENLDLSKDGYFFKDKEKGEVKFYDNYKDFFIEISKEGFIIDKISDKTIELYNNNKPEITMTVQYGYISHENNSKELQKEVNEYRKIVLEKIKSLEDLGVNLYNDQKNLMQEQFSFISEEILDK